MAKPISELMNTLSKTDQAIVGAKAAGWNAVWYNHRGHQAAGDVKPDAVVRSEAELIACLEKISTKE